MDATRPLQLLEPRADQWANLADVEDAKDHDAKQCYLK